MSGEDSVSEDGTCVTCGAFMLLEPGDEPTEDCDYCAREERDNLRADVARLEKERDEAEADLKSVWHVANARYGDVGMEAYTAEDAMKMILDHVEAERDAARHLGRHEQCSANVMQWSDRAVAAEAERDALRAAVDAVVEAWDRRHGIMRDIAEVRPITDAIEHARRVLEGKTT